MTPVLLTKKELELRFLHEAIHGEPRQKDSFRPSIIDHLEDLKTSIGFTVAR